MGEVSTIVLTLMMRELERILPRENYLFIKECARRLEICSGCHDFHHCLPVSLYMWEPFDFYSSRGDWFPKKIILCTKCRIATDEHGEFYNNFRHMKAAIQNFYQR